MVAVVLVDVDVSVRHLIPAAPASKVATIEPPPMQSLTGVTVMPAPGVVVPTAILEAAAVAHSLAIPSASPILEPVAAAVRAFKN